jgi:preprotein translocase subunit SecE
MNPLKALDFLAEVRVELTKVVWPSLSNTIRLTVIVILVTVIVGFFVGAIDYLLTEATRLLINR